VKNRGYEPSAAAGLWSASLKGRGFPSISSLRVRGERSDVMILLQQRRLRRQKQPNQ